MPNTIYIYMCFIYTCAFVIHFSRSFNMDLISANGIVFVVISFATFVSYVIFVRRRRSQSLNLPPGPPGWPILGNLVELIRAGKETEALFQRWAETYGEIMSFRIGGDISIALTNIDLIMEIMHHPFAQGRPQSVVSKKVFGPGHGIATSSGNQWKQLRKFVLDLFRKFGVGKSTFERIVTREADALVKEFKRQNGRAMKPDMIFSMATCNIICGVIFDQQLSYNDPKLLKTLESILEFFQQGGPGGSFFSSKLIVSLPFGPGKKIRNTLKELSVDWSKQIDQHAKAIQDLEPIEGKDFTEAFLLQEAVAGSDRSVFNRVSLLWNLKDLYLGGTETVSSMMQWAFLLLMTHPEVQGRCQEEMDEVVGRDKDPSMADRSQLPYVKATMEEIARIGSVTPLGGPHVAEEDIKFGEYDIPKGSLIFANLHFLHHHPKLWDDPMKFNPERFLDENGLFCKKQANIVFGVGKRACPGQELARMEFYLFMSRTLHRMSLKVPDGAIPPSISKAQTGFNRIPLEYQVCLVERDD